MGRILAFSRARRRKWPRRRGRFGLGAQALVFAAALLAAAALTRWPPAAPASFAAERAAPVSHAAAISGRAYVIDGDALDLDGQRIRLWGIDAPEAGQACARGQPGPHARAALVRAIGAGVVDCSARDRDAYGRTVAQCRAGGADLGATLVREGWAWDYARYSAGRYAAEQAEARTARRGVWAMGCAPAWEWRRN